MNESQKIKAELYLRKRSQVTENEETVALQDLAKNLEDPNDSIFIGIERDLYICIHSDFQREWNNAKPYTDGKVSGMFWICIGLGVMGFIVIEEIAMAVFIAVVLVIFLVYYAAQKAKEEQSIKDEINDRYVEIFRSFQKSPSPSNSDLGDNRKIINDGYSAKNNNDLGFDVPPQD